MKFVSTLLLLLLFILVPLNTYGQRKWKEELYQELNDNNFRDFKLFKKPLDKDKPDIPLLQAALFYVTNEARIEKGLKPLEHQPNLEIMAYNHSVQMAKDDFFDHYHPKDKKRKDPDDRAALSGILNPNIAENIHAVGGSQLGTYMDLADRIVQSWIDSPPHRATLYSVNAVQLGCGIYYYDGKWQNYKDVYKQGNGFWLSTQNFQLFTKVESGTSKDKGAN